MIKIKLKNTFVAVSIISVIGLSGCANQVQTPAQNYADLQSQSHEQAVDKEQERFNSIPKWFLNQPQNDDSGVYAVGTATSNNLQFSMNQAKLNAEFNLAKTMSQEVAGRERSYMRSGANGKVESDAESVVTKFVDAADIVGVNTVDSEVRLNDGKYTVYMLLHLSYEQQANILARKNGDATRMSAQQAYKEVEAELRRRKEERKKAVNELQELKGATVEDVPVDGTSTSATM